MVALGGGGTGTHWDGGTGLVTLGVVALGHWVGDTLMVALGLMAPGLTVMVTSGWWHWD